MTKIIYDFYTGEDQYSDGDIENDILDAVQHPESLTNKLSTDNRWAFQYHLNPQRQAILNVCDIKETDECLEIGAGCGAISSGIVKYTTHLDAIELSKRRSMINYIRNSNISDFNIFVGNFDKIVLNKQYDKIFLIGVLEYAKLYFPNHQNAFLYFLKKIKNLLKKDGQLFIAIENKYGIKYFSGASEDHTGQLFESIEGYGDKSATTFSNNEICDLLKKASFKDIYFYYPLPDYKFPEEIYSQDYLPTKTAFNYLGHSFDRERYVLFNESSAMREAVKSNKFDTFANSFLIKTR